MPDGKAMGGSYLTRYVGGFSAVNENSKDRVFLETIRSALDESAKVLDARTLSRLGTARNMALAYLERHKGGRRLRFRLAGFAAASAAVLAAVIFFSGPSGIRFNDNLEDVEILASGEQLEFLDELDFYAWLADKQDSEG